MSTVTEEQKLAADVPTVLTPPSPPAYSNHHKLYNPSILAVSSSDSLDSNSSSASTIKLTPSASSPSLPTYFEARPEETPQTPLRVPPPPLLRKKSGELVKSSLKLSSLIPKSMSTSHLIPNKSVRFASRLANVKMFDGLDSPSAVSSVQTTPLHSPPMAEVLSDDEYANDLDLDFTFRSKNNHKSGTPTVRNDYFEWNWNGHFSNKNSMGFDGDLTSDTSSDDQLNDWYSASTPVASKSKRYRIDSCDVQNHRVQNQPPVLLNSIKLLEEKDKTFLYGLINCQNLAFEKHLALKLTLNNWATNLTFSHKIITFHKSIPHTNIDQFQFKIPLDDLIELQRSASNDPFNSNISIQMCVKYTVNNHDYWDNNHNRNYHIVLKPCNNFSKSTPALSSTKKVVDTDDSFPQYDDLVSKLINFQNTSDGYTSSFSGHSDVQAKIDDYNLDTDSPLRKTTPARPPLMKQSYSASDVLAGPTQKYSQSYKFRQSQKESKDDLKFNSSSYTDLLANYCFSGGSSPVKVSSAPMGPYKSNENVFGISFASSCSPSSTFHSFSDSIHI